MTTSSSLARRATTAERVLALLAEQGGAGGLTRAEIGRALSVPRGTVDQAVIDLTERGAARQANAGLPARYVPTGGAFTPRGHLAFAPAPTEVEAAGSHDEQPVPEQHDHGVSCRQRVPHQSARAR